MPHFLAIGQPIAEILLFNGFQDVAVRHLGFLKFEIITGLIGPICVITPNFVVISQTVAELSRFNGFQYDGRPPSCISRISKF